MIIDSYNVSMNSSRKSRTVQTRETEEKRKTKGSNITTKVSSKDVLTISDEAREYLAKNRSSLNQAERVSFNENNFESIIDDPEKDDDKKNMRNNSNVKEVTLATAAASKQNVATRIEDAYTIKIKALLKILEALIKPKGKGHAYDFFDKMSKLSDNLKGLKERIDFDKDSDNFTLLNGSGGGSGSNTTVWQVERKESVFVKEEEVTAFSSTGVVKTADGREIAFNVSVEMSRSFEQYMEKQTSEEVVLQDPLVINLDSVPANISDQTFFFDLDADGEKEEISQLGKGSGFLALDKNGDGVINDGSELFGTMTGNGFEELAKYDDDGNGWIDEADAIYSKLKVWTKDENGKDVLLSLKEADLGAIYLNNVSTEFSVNDKETNQRNAQVRNTGVYLKESGGAGSIQQIDFAVRK